MQQKPHPQADTDDLAAEAAAAQADPVGLQGLAQQLNRIRQDNERLGQRHGGAHLELEDLEQEGLKGGRFDDDLETALFRVVQEAVSNALKHSGAQEVKIRLEHRPARRRLYLRVTDDGAGFDAAQALADRSHGAGFGLRGLRDRIEVLGGYFRLASQPGEGTMVEVELPLDEPGGKDQP